MDYQTIILQKEAGVATITLNRPDKRNALSEQMKEEVPDAIKDISKDDSVRAVILTGAGPAFCAGGDLNSPLFSMVGQPDQMRKFLDGANRIPLGFRRLLKPVIGAINGAAVGFGCSLAMSCDIIIASETARFGQVWLNVGYHPDTGSSFFLPRLIGIGRACELIFTGRIIDAREAEKIGLVNQVVAPDKLMDTTRALAQKLAKGPTVAMGLAKNCLYRCAEMPFEQALDYEMESAILTLQTEDQKEGARAFLEKREPKFKGK